MKNPQSQHSPKGDIIRSVAMLPIFMFIAYLGMSEHNYFLAIGSIVVWLLVILFATNYWFQSIVCLIGSVIALYYDVVWLVLVLWLLFLYLIYATNSVERERVDLPNVDKAEDNEDRMRAIIDLMMPSFSRAKIRTSIRIGSTVLIVLLSLLFVLPYLIPKVWSFILNVVSKL
jgi:hypothetical protein